MLCCVVLCCVWNVPCADIGSLYWTFWKLLHCSSTFFFFFKKKIIRTNTSRCPRTETTTDIDHFFFLLLVFTCQKYLCRMGPEQLHLFFYFKSHTRTHTHIYLNTQIHTWDNRGKRWFFFRFPSIFFSSNLLLFWSRMYRKSVCVCVLHKTIECISQCVFFFIR